MTTELPTLPMPSSSSDDEHSLATPVTDDITTTFPTFQYRSLDENPASIRLLVLQPVQDGDGSLLRCELVHVTFRSKPSYRALSYMWGTSGETKPLILNDQLFQVRENLYKALTGLRNEIEGKFLWVDGICINQSDDDERGTQVSLMDHIYTRAMLVIIWLEGDWSTAWTYEIKQNILAHAYWRRLWIVQEITLAATLKVVIGGVSISWDGLLVAITIPDPSPTDRQNRRIVENIDNKRKNRHGPANRLEVLLDSFQYAICQEPRDKIYGMLGLAHDCQDDSITADYAKPLFELYADVISFFCRRRKFNNLATNELDRSMRLVRFSQLLHRILEGLRQSEVPRTLASPLFRIRGAFGGEIMHLGPTYDEFLSVPKTIGKWKMSFETFYSKPDEVRRLRENNEAYSAQLLSETQEDLKVFPIDPQIMYSRAVVTDTLWQSEERQWQQQDPHLLNGDQTKAHEDTPTISNTELLTSEPRLFLGSNFFIGFAPAGAQCGDIFCQFWETNVVALLRQEESLAAGGEKVYRIVGRVNLSTGYLERWVPHYSPWHQPHSQASTVVMELDIRILSVLTC